MYSPQSVDCGQHFRLHWMIDLFYIEYQKPFALHLLKNSHFLWQWQTFLLLYQTVLQIWELQIIVQILGFPLKLASRVLSFLLNCRAVLQYHKSINNRLKPLQIFTKLTSLTDYNHYHAATLQVKCREAAFLNSLLALRKTQSFYSRRNWITLLLKV